MATAAGSAPGGLITGTRIAINVHYDQTEGNARGGSEHLNPAFDHSSTSGSESDSGSPRSSREGTPGADSADLPPPPPPASAAGARQDASVTPQQCQPDARERQRADHSSYTDGPDQVIPSTNLFCSDRHGVVKLRLGGSGPSAAPPVSLPTMMRRAASRFGSDIALRWQPEDESADPSNTSGGVQWRTLTYSRYMEQVETVARAFIRLGLERRGAVCILGFNSPHWFISALAAVYAGGLSAGVYTTNNTESCYHCAADSGCNIFVVEDDKQLAKVVQFRDKVPSLRAVVQYRGQPSRPGVLSWQQLLELGTGPVEAQTAELERRQRLMAVNHPAVLIYTSGTTGPPKGVMLSHDNVTFMAQNAIKLYGLRERQEYIVSYLPLSHAAALLVDVFSPICMGGIVTFADKNALKGSLGTTLAAVRPTVFLGVPRVYEKIKEGFEAKTADAKGLRRSLLQWALQCGRKSQQARVAGDRRRPPGLGLARRLVLDKIHRLLGLDRVQVLMVGAAPITYETIDFFHSLDLPLVQVYGMSETTGPHTGTTLHQDKPGTVGPTMPGFITRLDNPDAQGQGEICMGGRHVFMGYVNLPDKTAEATDADGWMHSGDLGMLDGDGFVSITGRLKELIITAGGENIPPVLIEEQVMQECHIVSNCCLVGDKRKFLSMLITLKVEVDLDTMEPTDKLTPVALEFCRAVGSHAKTVSDILRGPDELVMCGIQAALDRANSRAISAAQRVGRWTILPTDFSIASGELGPTMKMKRPVIHKKYASVIERLYA